MNLAPSIPANARESSSAHSVTGLYAHSLQDRPIREWQSLEAHLAQVAESSARFAQSFSSADWAWNAGLLHDIGKAAREFQAYLRRENDIDDPAYDGVGRGRINHSSAGAALAEERYIEAGMPWGRILAYLVAGHHAGLPDYHTCDGGRGALFKRLEEGRADLDRIRAIVLGLTDSCRQLGALPSFVKQKNFHFWVRMLFSCLTDADFLDTEAFMNPGQSEERGGEASLVGLKALLDQHMAELVANADDTPVNRARSEILKACRDAAKNEDALYSLTVPTGGGKTLAAMAFALDHAVLRKKHRIVYVIPYTSIIEQTAATLGGILGAENVVEHHSNLDPDKETERTRLASENWDAPVIVTTNVQFFESLYAARSSRCRKIHNLVDSVVILDEAQMIPPTLLTPCVAAINELSRNYDVTLVLATATQPALPGLVPPKEIIPPNLNLYERLRRTHISIPDDLNKGDSLEVLAGQLKEHDQVLCIVNTRRDCRDLFGLMPEGTVHLSALMCGQHRSAVIQSIKKRLEDGEPLRVISTQLVEAGVDIDFPVVYRALAGLDSIAQAAGRCNREGTLNGEGKVVVFTLPKRTRPGLMLKGENTTRELRTLPGFDPQSPNWFTRYFDHFYGKVNDTGEKDLKMQLTSFDTKILDLAFRTYGDNFRLIKDQDHRAVFVRHGEGGSLIEQLRHEGPSRTLMRRLQRYTVNVPVWKTDEMLGDGLLEEVWPGFLAQCLPSLYDVTFGLDVFRDTPPPEDLIG